MSDPAQAFRLTRLMQDAVDIWRQVPQFTAGGVAQASSWAKVASAVRCYYDQTPNLSDPTDALGRVKRPTLLTEDVLVFDIAANVKDADMLRCVRSRNPKAVGKWHRVQGAPQELPGLDGRIASQNVYGMSDENPDAALLAKAGS